MKERTHMTRMALARRLQQIALLVAAGKPVRVGKRAATVPDRVVVETELDAGKPGGERELEIEIKWREGRRR